MKTPIPTPTTACDESRMRTLLSLAFASIPLALIACAPEPLVGDDDALASGEGEGEGEGDEGEGEGAVGEGEGDEGEGEGAVGEGEGEGEGDVSALIAPPMPAYSNGACPTLVGGATDASSVVEGFASSDDVRKFRLLVPASYDGSTPYAVMFAWHWLNAGSGSFVSQGELETTIEQYPFIIVLPDGLENANGDSAYQFDWPFAETWGAEKELVFFDDLLSCVNENFNIDAQQVHAIGVSAGALWTTYLSTTSRANHLASVVSLSGGLGAFPLVGWTMQYAPQTKKFPAIVLWGGENDRLGVNFQNASIAYRDALLADGHFVVECTHDQGHAVPPIEAPPGQTKFSFLWSFMLDHPYDLPAGASPWTTEGLPSTTPAWCSLTE